MKDHDDGSFLDPASSDEPRRFRQGGRFTLGGSALRAQGARSQDSRAKRLGVTEPEFGNAIHRLLLGWDYHVTERPGEMTLCTMPSASAGNPFRLHVEVSYAPDASRIVVTNRSRNMSKCGAPVALKARPSRRAGPLSGQALTLTDAAECALVLDDTHIPRGDSAVAGTFRLHPTANLHSAEVAERRQ